MKIKALLSVCTIFALTACATSSPIGNSSVPQPTQTVEISKYLGHWYEIARYENRFEKNCEAVTADYMLKQNGDIQVVNTCHKGSVNGKINVAQGRAKIVPESNNAKLKVSFFRPFYGDYWILDRAPDYTWSIVGEPSGKYLWILARTPNLSQKSKADIIGKAQSLGYDTSILRWTKH